MAQTSASGTIGELFLALYEMGFDQSQVEAAVRAGCFRVQDAADWILQGAQLHGTLHTQLGPEDGIGAVKAFNPPQVVKNLHETKDAASNSTVDQVPCPPISSRRGQHRRDFEAKQSMNIARDMKEEKLSKKKDRELVLQRIADDRQKLQDKEKVLSPQKTPETKCQVTTGDRCDLMVRLPSGNSLRLGFSADSPLRSVCERLDSLHPSFAPCCLLQTFPTRHFSAEDLTRSLRDLGLTPNATLCVRTSETFSPPQVLHSCPDPPLSPREPPDFAHSAEDLMAEGGRVLPILRSPAHSVSHNFRLREVQHSSPTHSWGRGQRLMIQEDEGVEDIQEDAEGSPLVPRLPSSVSHLWPTDGVRLRPVDEDGEALSPSSPHVMARAAAELRQEIGERAPVVSKVLRVSAVPTLRHLALQGALMLIAAPCMQYPRSLSGLTPEVAEIIITHMTKEQTLRPRTLELFSGCPIRKITLNCYQYTTNELIKHLRGFPSLKSLSLTSCTLLTDQGVSVVQHLHKLQYLNLSSCVKLTDLCLQHISGLEHLTHLILHQTKVSDDGMCDFLRNARCSLTHLNLSQTAVTEHTLCLLHKHAPNLKVLSIKHNQITDVSSLCGLQCLNSLHLDSTRLTEESLVAVTSLSTLSVLTLSGVQSLNSDHVLRLLSGMSLKRLLLPGRHTLSDSGLALICGLNCLLELDLTDHTQITDHGVRFISELTRLCTLSLCNTSVSDSGLYHLRGLRFLEELSLDRTKVTSRGVSQCIRCLPHLQVLGLSDTLVGDNVLKLGIRHCPSLQKVNLSRTRVTNKGLRFLSTVSVVQLNLDASGVTAQGVSDLLSSCTSLTSVRATNLRVIPSEEVSDEEELPR
ncbi:uncharacterized protein LOC128659681 [Bombina bombina]|uniref:uncharacterized protein LOC128659681 n=1 Tax=Bombina bombina TaxID=8345 RepID=UPI00235AE8DF|nr:uncharacterized protein LOC128659681 [Bombina bombina]